MDAYSFFARRQRHGTLTREKLEEFIEKILRNSGKPVLNKLRDQARKIAPQLGMEAEAERLSAIIGAMLGTQDAPLSTDVAVSRSRGIGYDPDRLMLFEELRASLAAHPFAALLEAATANRNRAAQAMGFEMITLGEMAGFRLRDCLPERVEFWRLQAERREGLSE